MNELFNTENIWGGNGDVFGNAANLNGNIKDLFGDVSSLSGCCSRIAGYSNKIASVTKDLNELQELIKKYNLKEIEILGAYYIHGGEAYTIAVRYEPNSSYRWIHTSVYRPIIEKFRDNLLEKFHY